jgi:pimeloyl-ACP methyl ester carboxylesterase
LVRSTDFSTQRLTADAAALLDAVAARPAIVCGHSNGGRVAQLLALDYPGKVEKVILASSGGTHGSKGIPLAMCLGLVEKGYAAYVRDQAIANGFTRDFVENCPDRVERFLDVRLGNPPPLEIFLRHVIARQDYDAGNRLREIAIPTLVLVGDDEDHGPPGHTTHRTFAESLAREIPGAKLIVLEGQAHYYYYSDAETTDRAMRQFIAAT